MSNDKLPNVSPEEERYFSKKEFDRREFVRQRLERDVKHHRELRHIGEAVGESSTEIAERIRRLGFDGETAVLFNILPLVIVAWADGKVSGKERTVIFKWLESRGIAEDSEAWTMMGTLLEKRPDDEVLEEGLRLLALVSSHKEGQAKTLVDLCFGLAEAHGGFLGLGKKMSDEERTLIHHIAEVLGPEAMAEAQLLLKAKGAIG